MKNAIYWRGFGLGVAVGALFVWILAASALSKNADRENAALPAQIDQAAQLAMWKSAALKVEQQKQQCEQNFSSGTLVYTPAPVQGLNLANGFVSIVPGPALQAATSAGLRPAVFVAARVAVRSMQVQPSLYYSYVQNGTTSAIQMMPIANPDEKFRFGQPISAATAPAPQDGVLKPTEQQ